MYDQSRADKAVNFIKLLKHTKGRWAGVPFNLQPWQEEGIIRPLFGTINPDGLRQYRTAYIQMGRKNGKSELAATIALYLLFADGELGAEIYSAAADKEQAGLVFSVGAQMVRQNQSLLKRCKIVDSQKRIIIPGTNSFWRVLSAEAYTKHGLNPHAVIFDELHAQPNRDLWDVLTTGFGARTQPLMIAITTAGYDRHSICYEQYDYSRKILEGTIDDPTFLPVIYEVPEKADWKDEKLWRQANPGLGDFRSLDELRSMATKAALIPALQNTFRRLYLDQWTEQENRFIDMDAWALSAGEVPSIEELQGRECYGGLDLSTTTDVTALVLEFPWDDGTVKVLPFFWIPEEGMRERVNRDRVPYDVWVREGLVRATVGNVVDYTVMREEILALSERFNIREIAYDRYNASQLVQELGQEGLTLVQMGQGMVSMTAPTKELLNYILTGRFHHGNNPVMRWMASNTAAEMDAAGNVKPNKAKSTGRIDGIVAGIMALDRVIRHENTDSVYENEDVTI